jgi:ribosomal-protein-alanine acetyltransferase
MAVMEVIKSFFVPARSTVLEPVVPAPVTTYEIRPLTDANVKELFLLNARCFTDGDSYSKHTFNYLLGQPTTLSYRTVTSSNELVGFIFAMLNDNGAAHLTTIGVAPEHRRRSIARKLLEHLESRLQRKGVGTVVLEVRVGNSAAQDLYRNAGYCVVQRIANYYNNGEDCFLMMKSLI